MGDSIRPRDLQADGHPQSDGGSVLSSPAPRSTVGRVAIRTISPIITRGTVTPRAPSTTASTPVRRSQRIQNREQTLAATPVPVSVRTATMRGRGRGTRGRPSIVGRVAGARTTGGTAPPSTTTPTRIRGRGRGARRGIQMVVGARGTPSSLPTRQPMQGRSGARATNPSRYSPPHSPGRGSGEGLTGSDDPPRSLSPEESPTTSARTRARSPDAQTRHQRRSIIPSANEQSARDEDMHPSQRAFCPGRGLQRRTVLPRAHGQDAGRADIDSSQTAFQPGQRLNAQSGELPGAEVDDQAAVVHGTDPGPVPFVPLQQQMNGRRLDTVTFEAREPEAEQTDDDDSDDDIIVVCEVRGAASDANSRPFRPRTPLVAPSPPSGWIPPVPPTGVYMGSSSVSPSAPQTPNSVTSFGGGRPSNQPLGTCPHTINGANGSGTCGAAQPIRFTVPPIRVVTNLARERSRRNQGRPRSDAPDVVRQSVVPSHAGTGVEAMDIAQSRRNQGRPRSDAPDVVRQSVVPSHAGTGVEAMDIAQPSTSQVVPGSTSTSSPHRDVNVQLSNGGEQHNVELGGQEEEKEEASRSVVPIVPYSSSSDDDNDDEEPMMKEHE